MEISIVISSRPSNRSGKKLWPENGQVQGFIIFEMIWHFDKNVKKKRCCLTMLVPMHDLLETMNLTTMSRNASHVRFTHDVPFAQTVEIATMWCSIGKLLQFLKWSFFIVLVSSFLNCFWFFSKYYFACVSGHKKSIKFCNFNIQRYTTQFHVKQISLKFNIFDRKLQPCLYHDIHNN